LPEVYGPSHNVFVKTLKNLFLGLIFTFRKKFVKTKEFDFFMTTRFGENTFFGSTYRFR